MKHLHGACTNVVGRILTINVTNPPCQDWLDHSYLPPRGRPPALIVALFPQGRLPVRWMAIESLNYSVYTTKSDV